MFDSKLKYQQREDYKGYKRLADNFYQSLCLLLGDWELAEAEEEKKEAEKKLKALYRRVKKGKLYNERGGLYCTILEDAYRNYP
jgi:hypothetical protein